MERKYKRPNKSPELIKRAIASRANDYAGVIQHHLNIRLKEEKEFLMELCRRQTADDYIQWCEETEKRNSYKYSLAVKRYLKTAKSADIDLGSDKAKYAIGKDLLDTFINRKRKDVIQLRKALGLEHTYYTDNEIQITTGIENCELFRLFGSPIYLEDLKASYKKAAKELHPDHGGNEETMDALNKAYNFLKNNWDTYSPENLAIDPNKLKSIKSKTFTDPALRSFMDF